jgi:hydrogenase large subunit
MSWDPITRIVGSLGIHTEIDFENKQVLKCYSTSMVFRGFDIFMKGIDPRDTHFISSRICGICGDNHCTTSVLCQNMAYRSYPPVLGNCAYNLAEQADYMFDHAIFNDCMANVDFCEQMVKETNPSLLQKAESTPSPHGDIHGFKTIADIMRSLNPFTGEFYLETLNVARYTREMYCLFGGRHTHPSTIMPGGVSADITHQTCTDYYVRLMRYIDYVKRCVPMHDDLYDFFLQELPGYDMVGYRDTNLVCWGSFDEPARTEYDYATMTEWGRQRFVTPGVVINGELVTTDLVEINLMIRILLGSSYFDGWEGEETFVKEDPLGNPVSQDHPWNKTTLPKPQARDFTDKYSWVTSPRIYDERTDTHVACDTGGGPFARQWVTAKAGIVDFGYVKATGHSLQMVLPKTANMPEMELEWKVPEKSNAIERDRARSYHQAFSALSALYNLEAALAEIRAGRTKSCTPVVVPNDAVSVGFHEAARGVLSHHMVIRDGKVANYQPFPPTPWNGSSRDKFGTPGPYEDAVQNTPIFEENGPDNFKGVDIMRAVRSFDPCLPCGVHMYTGKGVKKVMHTPTGLS